MHFYLANLVSLIKKLQIGSSILTIGLLSYFIGSEILKSEWYKEYTNYGHVKSSRLYVNENPDKHYYVDIDKKELIKQLDSLAKNALKEEFFVYVPKIKRVYEIGEDETDKLVTYSLKSFSHLAKKYDELELYHYHPAHTDSTKIQKEPSNADVVSYFKGYVSVSILNSSCSFSGNHVSAHGLTTYNVTDDAYFKKSKKLYFSGNNAYYELELKRLRNLVFQFFEEELFIKKLELNPDFKPVYSELYDKETASYLLPEGLFINKIVDMDPKGGAKSAFFYINFIPIKDGELQWNSQPK